MRRIGPGGQARLPGYRDRYTRPVGAHDRRGRRPRRAPSRASLARRPHRRLHCRSWPTWSSRASSAGPQPSSLAARAGLGEVTAKLLAAGGARVAISYRVGSAEAEAVAQEIRSAGGICETLAYDASLPAEPQLAGLAAAPTHAYYFATPKIFGAQSALFARARLDAFLNVYVDGFLDLAQALRARRGDVSLLLSVVSSRRRAAARHARIRHDQSGRRDALRRDERGMARRFTSRSIASRVCRPIKPPPSSEAPCLLRSSACCQPCGRRSPGRVRAKARPHRPAHFRQLRQDSQCFSTRTSFCSFFCR